jgi:WD40-like Beta Propeller Repeat
VQTSTDVSAEAIRTQLERILASPGFVHSDRMARFLRFTVDQTIQGHVDSIKESVLGLEVFDRTASFDPRTDTIVRVEARRLRSKLKEYYEGEGRGDPILIDFRKGSYVPTFLLVNGRSEVPQASLSPRSAPTQPLRVASLIQWHLGITIAAGLLLVAVSVGITWWFTRLSPPAQPPSKLTRLTSDLGLTYQPALSSDGKLVAYASDRSGEGNLDIWVKQVTGGEPVRLTHHLADDYEPAFSANGGKIAFRSERDGGGVYTIPSLGGEERLIVPDGRRPRFSPDDKQITCWSGMPGHIGYLGTSGRVYIVTLSEGVPRELRPRFDVARHPIWSPDGKHLVVLGLRNKEEETARRASKENSPQDLLDWWVVSLDTEVAARIEASSVLSQSGLSRIGGHDLQPGSWITNDEGQADCLLCWGGRRHQHLVRWAFVQELAIEGRSATPYLWNRVGKRSFLRERPTLCFFQSDSELRHLVSTGPGEHGKAIGKALSLDLGCCHRRSPLGLKRWHKAGVQFQSIRTSGYLDERLGHGQGGSCYG